ncbi:kunitz-type trypsin inhibitor alpha chain-like [Senna tora]|uniref:Kunitz-type trypsin inhibitor alpha chain-like n=1 Tax=Senna tora TaxID=362788 RepID=A0A834T168_9FABA|nr:kunitz-type trypsin inhibitor alpha chain-like [Senna tora]
MTFKDENQSPQIKIVVYVKLWWTIEIAAPFSFLLFLAFAFAVATTTTTAELVFDSAGQPVLNGGTYVVAPTTGPIFNAAIIDSSGSTCSLAVIQQDPGFAFVLPVTITALVRPTFVTTSMKLFISFDYIQPNVCTNNSNWVITKSSNDDFEYVMVGDSGNPIGSSFYIRPYGTTENLTYKLVSCEGDICRNIGVHVDSQGFRRLVVTDGEPLVVKFDKYYGKRSFASEISMVV